MDYANLFVPVDPASSINDSRFEKEFSTLPHSSYEWERAYCAYVRAGDVQGARKFMERIARSGQSISVGNVSQNSITRTKYLAVALISVITRVAINSGADELLTYQLSDKFLQFLDNCNDNDTITQKLFLTTDQMIQSVHDAKETAESNLHFIRCREFISSHLGEKITVNNLAEYCGLTPNYLSCIFKKISGKTISEYILEKRIETAKQLLLSNEYTSSEIATFLGFNSQSYFIACFKKQIGETPRRWKMRHGEGTGMELYPGL